MESLVEGVFGRAFRRQIHPVEIAKALTKQMDEGRMVSISRTYAPNDFTVHLSEEDVESIRAYQAALRDELIQYASTHAENKDYHLMTPPRVRFETEDSLRFGEFGITAKLTGGDGPREKDAPQDTSGQTRIFRTEEVGGEAKDQGTSAISPEEAQRHGLAREVVEDLGSTNGTLLDGAPIDRERIESGDELTFGQSTARLVRRIDSSGEGG